jgi:hypothetical protein
MCPGAAGTSPGASIVREGGNVWRFFVLLLPEEIVSRCCGRKRLYLELETIIKVVRKRLLNFKSSFMLGKWDLCQIQQRRLLLSISCLIIREQLGV